MSEAELGAFLHEQRTVICATIGRDGWPHLYSIRPSEKNGRPLLLTPGSFLVEQVTLTPDGRFVIYNANAGSTSGDFDRRQVLSASLRRDATLTGKSALGVLEAAGSMQSDNERSAVLLEVIQRGGLTGDTSDQFFAAVTPMRSSYEQRRVLEAVAAESAVPEGVAIGLLKAAATIRADNDRAEVLISFARRHAISAAARPFYLTAADGIRSEWDQTRALAELVRSERRGK